VKNKNRCENKRKRKTFRKPSENLQKKTLIEE
jgi:hypothetical protein